MKKMQELDYLINENFSTRDRESRVKFMQENFGDGFSEIDEALSVNKRTELFFSNDENTCRGQSQDLQDGRLYFYHK